MTRNALISVSDKTNLVTLCQFLIEQKFTLFATSSTYKFIQYNGMHCHTVESITNFPEILDGRVKTLHPKIFGGILCRSNSETDQVDLTTHNIHPFELVVCNLYPFEKVIQNTSDRSEWIENIDIGGVSLLRAAAKNYHFVTTLSSPNQYEEFMKNFGNQNKEEFNLNFGLEAFQKTSQYDSLIFETLRSSLKKEEIKNSNEHIEFPEKITLELFKSTDLRYGENPHQKAALYDFKPSLQSTINLSKKQNLTQLHGKELSFNNWLDIDHALNLTSEMHSVIPISQSRTQSSLYSTVIVKHNTPCGVGISSHSLQESFEHAFAGDKISPFGGIVSFNHTVNEELAHILSQIFLEVIVAPQYSLGALEILKQKKNIRLMQKQETSAQFNHAPFEIAYKPINGGFLLQTDDNTNFDLNNFIIPTKLKPNQNQLQSLRFANAVVKHVRSNAIAIANEKQTISISGGFTNRVDAVRNCLEKATLPLQGSVLASDAFFPFADSIELLKDSGINAIIEPGGSMRDAEVIEACNKYEIALVFSGVRHFKH